MDYPIHLGVTEAEKARTRASKRDWDGSLLADGIGDTIRVSLTEDSIQEIPVAKALVAMTSAVWRRVAGKGRQPARLRLQIKSRSFIRSVLLSTARHRDDRCNWDRRSRPNDQNSEAKN